jgi:hypothetical protein
MLLSFKTALIPNNRQITAFRKAFGVAYPKISCSAGILPANNTRTGKIPLQYCSVKAKKQKYVGWVEARNPTFSMVC